MSVSIYESDRSTVLTHFTQWDTNRVIAIRGLGLTAAPIIQFYNAQRKRALVVNSEISGTDIVVPVPNLILQDGISLMIDVYKETTHNPSSATDTSDTEGRVIYTFRVPVTPKPMPEDYVYTENIGYVSWVELSRRAEELLEKLEQTDFRMNDDTKFVEFTVDGETWKPLFSISEIKGEAGEIHSVTASIDEEYGTPYVDVTLGGTSTDRTFDFAFHNVRAYSPTAEVTGTESTVTITMVDRNGTTSQTLGRYASLLPRFDIDPVTGDLYTSAVSGYLDMEFYIDEDNGHLNVTEAT